MDVYQITGLPIVGEIYDKFFPTNKLMLDKKLAMSFRELFCIWPHLFTRTHWPRFTEWVKKSVPECLDNMPLKHLNTSMEIFENWWYSPNLILMKSFI